MVAHLGVRNVVVGDASSNSLTKLPRERCKAIGAAFLQDWEMDLARHALIVTALCRRAGDSFKKVTLRVAWRHRLRVREHGQGRRQYKSPAETRFICDQPSLDALDCQTNRRMLGELAPLCRRLGATGLEFRQTLLARPAVTIDEQGNAAHLPDLAFNNRKSGLFFVSLAVKAKQLHRLDLVVAEIWTAECGARHSLHQGAKSAAVSFAVTDVAPALAHQEHPHCSRSLRSSSSPTLNQSSPTLSPALIRSWTPGSVASGAITVSPLACLPKTRTHSGGTKSSRYGE
jgi:hypothetical protein